MAFEIRVHWGQSWPMFMAGARVQGGLSSFVWALRNPKFRLSSVPSIAETPLVEMLNEKFCFLKSMLCHRPNVTKPNYPNLS